jgi:23S rRNA (uracil1939-C5)-methyltransferase
MAHAPATVVDGYAGTGDLAVAFAARGVEVHAIELDGDASAVCASRLAAPSRAIAGRVEDVLPALLPADVVLLNPPRAGVDEAVTRALGACHPRPRAIIYVSCDPATLARDVARLPGWQVSSLASFDMFPQTAHVESVCELVPEVA